MGRFLQVGEFLLGQFALAVAVHDQLLVLKLYMLDAAAGAEFFVEVSDCVCEGRVACRLVVGVPGVVVVGYFGMVEARKVERGVA